MKKLQSRISIDGLKAALLILIMHLQKENGRRFSNEIPERVHIPDLIQRILAYWMKFPRPDWPEKVEITPATDIPARLYGDDLRVTFVNHATFLIQTRGMNILTDPIWSERASPVNWAGPKRVHEPGIRFDDLPDIDFVWLSHNHYDHMDIPTLKALKRRFNPTIITGTGNGKSLRKAGIQRIIELGWWQSIRISEAVKFIYVPAQHRSNRGLLDMNKALWGGLVMTTPDGPVYFSGDTGFGPHYQQLAGRFGEFRLTLLPIGAFKPNHLLGYVHQSPEESVKAHQILNSRQSIGIHFGCFNLTFEAWDEPVQELAHVTRLAGLEPDEFLALMPGEHFLQPVWREEKQAAH